MSYWIQLKLGLCLCVRERKDFLGIHKKWCYYTGKAIHHHQSCSSQWIILSNLTFMWKWKSLKSEPTSDFLDIDEAWHIADSADSAQLHSINTWSQWYPDLQIHKCPNLSVTEMHIFVRGQRPKIFWNFWQSPFIQHAVLANISHTIFAQDHILLKMTKCKP